MSEYTRRHEVITYDGTNSTDVLAFMDPIGGSQIEWSITGEVDDVLTILCNDSFNGSQNYVYNLGDSSVRHFPYPDGTPREIILNGNPGPWSSVRLAEGFQEVPTMAEFNALVARVAELENP